jgi:hypothetical protein
MDVAIKTITGKAPTPITVTVLTPNGQNQEHSRGDKIML